MLCVNKGYERLCMSTSFYTYKWINGNLKSCQLTTQHFSSPVITNNFCPQLHHQNICCIIDIGWKCDTFTE